MDIYSHLQSILNWTHHGQCQRLQSDSHSSECAHYELGGVGASAAPLQGALDVPDRSVEIGKQCLGKR